MDIKKIIMFSFFTILFAVLIVVLCCSHEGVSVHIKNNTESELNDIVLEFTGGKETISQLPPGKTIAKLVNPAGESSLDVSYNLCFPPKMPMKRITVCYYII